MEDNTSNFIDFIGVERFDVIIDSYLTNIVNCIKIKEKEFQISQLITCKLDWYIQNICSLRGQVFRSRILTQGQDFSKWRGFDVGLNMKLNFCYLLILIFSYLIFIMLGFGLLFPWFYVQLMFFKSN